MGAQRKSRFTQLVLLFLVAVLSITLVAPAVVNAKPKSAEEEAKSWIYYQAIGKCFFDAFDYAEGVSLDDIRAYKWFQDKSVSVGVLNTSSSGTGSADCNDTNLVRSAMSLWGYTDPVTAFCQLMVDASPSRTDGGDCNGGKGQFKLTGDGAQRATSFKHVVETGYYQTDGGVNAIEPFGGMTAPAKYWLYYNSFVNFCKAAPLAKADALTDEQKNIQVSDKGFDVKWVNDQTRAAEQWVFEGKGGQNRDSSIGIYEDSNRGGYPECWRLAAWTSENADAYAQYAVTNNITPPGAPAGETETGTEEEVKSSCGVKGGMGWVVCPVLQFLGDTVDYMYTFIADQLEVPVKLFDTSSGTYTAWAVFRDYANVAFIIAFLFIVYSQVTSVGISNYGIKKMLPKLIIGAILVNTSFFICQFAVDITNLAGQGITHLFNGIAKAVSGGTDLAIGGVSGTDGGGNFGGMIGTILIGGVILVVALALGLVGPILLAVGLVFLILLLRQVLVVILIAISPLAFVAYLLPNTEKWFKKWSDMFMKVLMVFPIVALVIGASKVASAIIAAQSKPSTDGIVAQSGDLVNGLIAAAVLTIPFFVIPGLLSRSLEATGAFGKKLSNWSQKANGRIGKKYDKSSFAEGRRLRKAGKEQYKRRKFAERVSGEGGIRGWGTRRLARGGAGLTPSFLRTGGAAAGLATLAGHAEAQADEGFEKDVKAAGLQYATMSSGDIMEKLVDSNGNINQALSAAQRSAAIDRVMASGSFGERRQLVEAANDKMSDGEKARVSKGVYAKGDQNIYGSGIGAKIQSTAGVGGADQLRQITLDNIKGGHVNAEHLVQGEGSAEYMVDVARGETTQLNAQGEEMKDANGNKIKVAHASVAGHTSAVNQLQGARTQAQQNTGTRAKATGGAMSNTLNRL
ncbi:MAG: hypothetical protein WBP12_04250 [Candidatus Saccharimonas sp.]